MKKKICYLLFIICLCVACSKETSKDNIVIAMPYSDNVQNPDKNYYIKWIEEQTGYNIEIVTIKQDDANEYMTSLFKADSDIDMVFFSEDFFINYDSLEDYAKSGEIACLDDYIDDKCERFNDIKVDGSVYCAPNIGRKKSAGAGQILWLNVKWLQKLNIAIPTTTEELEDVLTAFKNSDINGNGIKDEIPLLGSNESCELNSVLFLINSYVYYDPYNTGFYMDNGNMIFAPKTDQYREALRYCRRLYEKGLIDERDFYYEPSQLIQMINNSENFVGGFTTRSISDVLYITNPEISAKYVHVPPLKGPGGEKNALYIKDKPMVGGVILSSSDKKEEAFEIMKLMLSDEASVIARYGEQTVDWNYSNSGDLSIYGTPATIVTINYLWNVPQNKHLGGIGPMYVDDKYLVGVTWNGINSDMEYIDARAELSYINYFPKEQCDVGIIEKLYEYVNKNMYEFIVGIKDIDDDSQWESYVKGCYENGLEKKY